MFVPSPVRIVFTALLFFQTFSYLIGGHHDGHHHVQQGYTQCRYCMGTEDRSSCQRVTCRQLDEVCYVRAVQISGVTRYWEGCVHSQYCSSGNLLSSNVHGGIQLCARCCSNTGCNGYLCEESGHVTVSTPKPVVLCMACINDGHGCSHLQHCRQGEVCFLQQLKSTVLTSPGVLYQGGCISKTKCGTVAHTSYPSVHGLTSLVKGECCYTETCNVHILQKYQAAVIAASSTTKPTVPTIETTARTHSTLITTTTTVTSSTPTTVSQTTVTTKLTSTPIPMKCNTCSGTGCGVTFGSEQVETCPKSKSYCMNTVQNLMSGQKRITKKCSDETECNNRWWEKAECISFHPLTNYSFPFTCSYCCTSPRCNRELYPSMPHLYTDTVLQLD